MICGNEGREAADKLISLSISSFNKALVRKSDRQTLKSSIVPYTACLFIETTTAQYDNAVPILDC